MFDETSRYARIETARLSLPDGRTVSYVRRRFLPRAEDLLTLSEARVQPGDRLDRVAHRGLGDPRAWWRIADAEGAMDPSPLTEEPGRVLRVPVPGAER